MPFITREDTTISADQKSVIDQGTGLVQNTWTNQQYENQEYLADDHPDMLDKIFRDKVKRIRPDRNQRLSASDWTQGSDAPLTAAQKTAWKNYRQELRDFPVLITAQNIDNPPWPIQPV